MARSKRKSAGLSRSERWLISLGLAAYLLTPAVWGFGRWLAVGAFVALCAYWGGWWLRHGAGRYVIVATYVVCIATAGVTLLGSTTGMWSGSVALIVMLILTAVIAGLQFHGLADIGPATRVPGLVTLALMISSWLVADALFVLEVAGPRGSWAGIVMYCLCAGFWVAWWRLRRLDASTLDPATGRQRQQSGQKTTSSTRDKSRTS